MIIDASNVDMPAWGNIDDIKIITIKPPICTPVNHNGPRQHFTQGYYRLEPDSGKSDGAPPTGLRCELPTGNKAVPLPLYWLYRVLLRVEWLVIALYHTSLGE